MRNNSVKAKRRNFFICLMKIGQIFKKSDFKTLTKNFSALAILQVMRYFIPLIVLPYVTPIIGLEHFGEIAIASSITLIVQVFVNYSFSFMGARDIARNKDDKDRISDIVSTTIFAYALIYIVMLGLAGIVIFCVPKFRALWLVISVTLTIPIFSALVCEWYFQGIEKMENITIVNVLSRIVFLVLVFLFIKDKEDYLLYPVFNALGFVIAAVYSILMMVFKYKCKIRIPSAKMVLGYIKQGKDLFLNSACMTILNKMPNILLGTLSGASSAGLYDAAFRLQDAGYHSVDTLNRTFFPFLARRMDKHKAYRRVNLLFAACISIFLFVFAPFLVRLLYAPEFTAAVQLLRILAISVFFLGISSAYGVNYLLLIGKEKLVRNITFCVSAVGCALLVVLIRLYNERGAAIAMAVINASLALSYYVTVKKVDRGLQSRSSVK
ncbi:MAG: flippase [Bacteroidales bacterium]|nr:flippase [Bacteroidales bacterium]